jgi:hypothetical protein
VAGEQRTGGVACTPCYHSAVHAKPDHLAIHRHSFIFTRIRRLRCSQMVFQSPQSIWYPQGRTGSEENKTGTNTHGIKHHPPTTDDMLKYDSKHRAIVKAAHKEEYEDLLERSILGILIGLAAIAGMAVVGQWIAKEFEKLSK